MSPAVRPVVVAEQRRRTLTFSSQDIASFARLTGDAHPLLGDADEPTNLLWAVAAVDGHPRLGGWRVLADGCASLLDRLCVVGRGTRLVKAHEVPA